MSAATIRWPAGCPARSGFRSGRTRSSRSCDDPRRAPMPGTPASRRVARGSQPGGTVTAAETAPAAGSADSGEPLLAVTGLQKYFPIRRGVIFQRQVGAVQAVDGLDFTVARGETLALVG